MAENKAIPVQIILIIRQTVFDALYIDGPNFLKIDINIFERITQLFDFKYIGSEALKCVNHIFDTNNDTQINYLLENGITNIMFNTLNNKTTEDIILDKENHRITNNTYYWTYIECTR